MIFAEEFYDVESAFIDIEMNVAFLKIRSMGFPYFSLRVQRFNGLPCGSTDALAVAVHIDIEKLQLISFCLRMDSEYNSTDYFAILNNVIALRTFSFKGTDHVIPGNDFAVKGSELFHDYFLESNLDIPDEGFLVFFLSGTS